MPAHITVLYPFLPDSELGPVEIDAISDFSRSIHAFQTVFSRLGHFPAVLWVDPDRPSARTSPRPSEALLASVPSLWEDKHSRHPTLDRHGWRRCRHRGGCRARRDVPTAVGYDPFDGG